MRVHCSRLRPKGRRVAYWYLAGKAGGEGSQRKQGWMSYFHSLTLCNLCRLYCKFIMCIALRKNASGLCAQAGFCRPRTPFVALNTEKYRHEKSSSWRNPALGPQNLSPRSTQTPIVMNKIANVRCSRLRPQGSHTLQVRRAGRGAETGYGDLV
jgi:hypothetical protein